MNLPLSTATNSKQTECIRIRGLVQGVGFRPTVWQLAQQFDVHGEVRNDGSGVQIIAYSLPQNIDALIKTLHAKPPALARIDSIEREVIDDVEDFAEFIIVQSVANSVHTGMVADAATCSDCLDDINNANNRRFAYAFTNCTHCGPRLSIVKNIPYDRANTSMSRFILCPACEKEYTTPSDRRFHAQPNACPDCGPALTLCDKNGEVVATKDPIAHLAQLIEQGNIVAIKGIGGFQLACDASNEAAVVTLRQRKNRPHKALALMAASIAQIKQYCWVSEAEKNTLSSAPAPIALLAIKPEKTLAQSVAPAHKNLGFMLPYSPLHHLLMQQLDNPIVLTSGNAVNEPQAIDNQQALTKIGSIADFFLHHDRDIINRIDDSVVRHIDSQLHYYRRARGYAPAPIHMPESLPTKMDILACGSEMKNTFCLLRDGQATLSQHIGNLDNAQTYDDYLDNLDLYHQLYQFKPQAIAVDLHPEYRSSKYGHQLAETLQIPLIEVQHHHAHIASCLADNQWQMDQGKVIGVALDGLGFGTDGSIWGGEFLVADYLGFERHAALKQTAMLGGNQASREPWRNTFAHLYTHADWQQIMAQYSALPMLQRLNEKPLKSMMQMLKNNLNSPLSSSCGRLFDAVAFALGLCPNQQSYDGQAAIELENLINEQDWLTAPPYSFAIEQNAILEINPAPMWSSLLDDLQSGVTTSVMSASFHRGLAQAIITIIQKISSNTGISNIALSGGVFQNRSLLIECQMLLEERSFTVLTQQQVPANDGGLSLGEAAIAAAQLAQTT